MCEPTLIATGLGIAGTIGSYVQQSAAADAQTEAYEQNIKNANDAFVAEQKTLNDNAMQQQDQAAAAKLDMAQEARRAVATNKNTAAAAGVTGLSVDSLLQDLELQEATRQSRADTNLQWNLADIGSKKKASVSTWQSRVNSMSPGQQPSLLGLGLGIAGNALSGYNQYEDRKLKLDRASR